MTMMKRNGEKMQPCQTPETISKNSVYPLAVLTATQTTLILKITCLVMAF